MLESLAWVPENFSLPDSMLRLVISTGLLVVAIIILRNLTARFIRRNIASSELRGLEVPSVDPRVTIQAPIASEIHLTVRLPAKSGQRSYIEQAILSEVFASTDFSSKKPRPSDDESEDKNTTS